MFPRNKRTCPPTVVRLMIRALSNLLSQSGDSKFVDAIINFKSQQSLHFKEASDQS